MDLSQATDELLAAPWEAFVETRTRLADELARAGKRDDGRALKKIRRPSAAAWATNQVVRRARPAVDGYLAASDQLRARQGALMGGGGDRAAYQAAAESFRQATAALTQAVRQVLAHGGREPDRGQIEGVMANARAAAADGDRRTELLAARLLADLPQGEEGLAGVFGAGLAASAAATPPVSRPAHQPERSHEAPRHPATQEDRQAEAHAKREAEARARREAHERQLAAAVADESSARDAANAASAEVEQARGAREQAEEQLKDAEAALARAREALQDAKAALHAAERTAKERQAAAERATEHRKSVEKRAPG